MSHIPQTDTFRWVHFIITALILPAIWVLHGQIEGTREKVNMNAEQIAATVSNRFTSQDGLDVWKEIGAIRTVIAGMPPQEYRDKLTTVEKELNITNQRLARIEALLKGMER